MENKSESEKKPGGREKFTHLDGCNPQKSDCCGAPLKEKKTEGVGRKSILSEKWGGIWRGNGNAVILMSDCGH